MVHDRIEQKMHVSAKQLRSKHVCLMKFVK